MKALTNRNLNKYVVKNQYRFYYSRLCPEKQVTYDDLLDGYMKHKRYISVNASSIEEIGEIHNAICYDVPELFFIKSVKVSINPFKPIVTVHPEYRFDFDTCERILVQMEKTVISTVQRISMLGERERVKQIHDYIARNITYKDLHAPYSHETPGAILYGIAVCEGISKAFKYMADRSDIKSIVMIGNAKGHTGQTDSAGGHAWNIVYVDAVPFHLDVTFDHSLSSSGSIRYDYFLLSDDQVQTDHFYERIIECSEHYEYYKTIDHYAVSKGKLKELVRTELRPNKPLVIKMPDFDEKKAILKQRVMEIVSSSLPFQYCLNRKISMSYNESRNIFLFELV